MFQRLFREAQLLIQNADNPKDKKEAMEFLLRCIKEFTDFLERFFVKPREVSVGSVNPNDNKLEIEVIYGSKD